MYLNILKIFIRNIFRQVFYTILNVGGLAIGIASSFIILIYVIQELSYEKHFDNREQIYRVATKFMTMGEFARGPGIFMEIAPEELPWIKQTCKVTGTGLELSFKDFSILEEGLVVEPSFFEMFSYRFTKGDPSAALKNRNSIVLSKDLAEKIFENEDPLGQLIEVDKEGKSRIIQVTGVIDLENARSHLNAPYWIRGFENEGSEMTSGFNDNWLSVECLNYVKVTEGIRQKEMQASLDRMVENHVFPVFESTLTFEEWFKRDDSYHFILQPLEDIYLKGTLLFDLSKGGDEATVKTLLAIAVLIIVVAAVNFVNLTTARAANRGKEVGIKKMMGTRRGTLALQFISESVLICLLAVVVAFGLAELGLILFKWITGQALLDIPLLNGFNIGFVLVLSIVVGIVAGIYPAFYISSFSPYSILKGDFYSIKSNTGFRNVLVVFQFTLSIILIICTAIMFRQVNFIRNMDKGFDQDNVLIIDNSMVLGDKMKAFKNKLSQRSEVKKIALANRYPGSSSSFSITTLKSDYIEEPVKVNRFRGDYAFLETLDFDLIEGRNFSPEIASDSNAVILNQTAVKALSLEDPLGEILNDNLMVIGIVGDFNFESMRKKINPAVITLEDRWSRIAVKVNLHQAYSLISFIEDEWKSFEPGEPLRYHFLDENFENLMRNEIKMARVVSIFTILAILISYLGLFGLAAYVANQRKKEIGVRKVFGASVTNILLMLNINFSKLIVIAALISIPVSAYLMREWLSDFAYRVNLSIGLFVIAVGLTLFIALVSVSFQSFSAATQNPANSLKDE